MEVPRGEEVSTHLVSRAVQIRSPPPRETLRAASHPRLLWDAPGESTVVGGGVAAALDAPGGTDRFDAVRTGANSLLDSGDVHAGTEAACPRLFGGFAFHDEGTDDVFRVSIRDGRVRLHVLPETEPAGLQQFYERLTDESEAKWRIERRVEDSAGST